MKTKVYVFTKNNVRVIVNPAEAELEAFKAMPNAVINPELGAVKGMPLHFWKQNRSGNIVPMTPKEMEARKVDISKNGIQNAIQIPVRYQAQFAHTSPKWYLIAKMVFNRAIWFALGAFSMFILGGN